MFETRQWLSENKRAWMAVAVLAILFAATVLGYVVSRRWLMLLGVGIAGLVLTKNPRLGLFSLIVTAVIPRFTIGTRTEVGLNLATMMIPATLGVWFLNMAQVGRFEFASSYLNKPLLLFLMSSLLSLLIGNATWDPGVHRSGFFVIVQLAQWVIFAFSAGALWLTANLVDSESRLRRLAWFFLAFAGMTAILTVLPGVNRIISRVTTGVMYRAPFWVLLTALAAGQLLYNQELSVGWRVFLTIVVIVSIYYTFFVQRSTVSYWIGVASVLGVLVWFRWPRLRWLGFGIIGLLVVTGVLWSLVWGFAGGEDEWESSGGSRLALIGRVIDVTMRNPITGLGPAAYRPYARTKPLLYGRALWLDPNVSSHNNYVDLFAHGGLLGLGLFGWFAAGLVRMGLKLVSLHKRGFSAGYVNAMLAAWIGSMVLMLFADWMLPFVYNIGFPGFQASVLIWLFMGGMISIDHIQEHG